MNLKDSYLRYVNWSGQRKAKCPCCGVTAERRKDFRLEIKPGQSRDQAFLDIKKLAEAWERAPGPVIHAKCEAKQKAA